MGLLDIFAKSSPEQQERQHRRALDLAGFRERHAVNRAVIRERRWFASLPAIAVVTCCFCVGLLTLAMSFVAPTDPRFLVKPAAPGASAPAPRPSEPAQPKKESTTLKGENHFGYREHLLTPPGQAKILGDLANCLRAPEPRTIEIVGHADCLENYERNIVLSVRRAVAVKAFLEKRGVAGRSVAVSGRGQDLADRESSLCESSSPPNSPENRKALAEYRRVNVTCRYSS